MTPSVVVERVALPELEGLAVPTMVPPQEGVLEAKGTRVLETVQVIEESNTATSEAAEAAPSIRPSWSRCWCCLACKHRWRGAEDGVIVSGYIPGITAVSGAIFNYFIRVHR